MNTGMQDAFNLAWKLAMVVRGEAAGSLLDSYSPERSAVGDDVLKAAGRLTAVATLSNPVAQTLRNLAAHAVLGLPRFTHGVADTMAEVAIHYAQSPLNGPHARTGAQPGDRIPPVAGQTPIGSGDAPRFVLCAEQTEAVVALAARFSELVDAVIKPPLDGAAVSLVRPDGYLACSAPTAEPIADYLARLTRSAVSSDGRAKTRSVA